MIPVRRLPTDTVNTDTTTLDSTLDCCRDQRRRVALGVLADESESVTLDDLAAAVLEHDHHVSVGAGSDDDGDDDLQGVRVSLHHVHLPKLAAAGVVAYDLDRRVVEPTDGLGETEPVIATILDADPSLGAPAEP